MNSKNHFAFAVLSLRRVPRLLIAFAILSSTVLHAQNYRFKSLGTLGGNTSYAVAINNHGQVVGSSLNASGVYRAFMTTEAGPMINLGTLGGNSYARDINDDGIVVGNTFPNGKERAFAIKAGSPMILLLDVNDENRANAINRSGQVAGALIDNTSNQYAIASLATALDFKFLGSLTGGDGSTALDINDQGLIVGHSSSSSGHRGFLTSYSGTMATLGTLGGSSSIAWAINNPGTIVGGSQNIQALDRAFVRPAGLSLQDLGTLGGNSAEARGINQPGDIVGTSTNAMGIVHAFVRRAGGQLTDLNTVAIGAEGYTIIEATAINDAGQIVGAATNNATGFRTAFLLTPFGPAIVSQPQSQVNSVGSEISLSATIANSTASAYQWRFNGAPIPGATSATYTLRNLQPASVGSYTVQVTDSQGTATSEPAFVGLSTTAKVTGAGQELQPTDIQHPNGNVFDQVLLTGAAESIKADFAQGQITRTSFIDADNDIVQIEFSGPGTLSLVLDNPTGPAGPLYYNQATNYMKGHAGIVITGADERTNVSVFTVGRITAVNQALFKPEVTYDGIADIAFIAIASTNGKFGGVRTSNANYYAAKGLTGLYAPGIEFNGPIYIGNITAFDTATPVIIIGSTALNTWITGGDLWQENGRPVQVSGLTRLVFTAGSDSHGNLAPSQFNQAVLQQNGTDVTAQVVVNPTTLLRGLVRDGLTGNGLGAVILSFKDTDGGSIGTVQTNSSGEYAISPLPGVVTATVTRAGYVSTSLIATVVANTTVQADTVLFAQSQPGNGTVSGRITNALTGFGLSGVTVRLRSGVGTTTGAVVATTITNSAGNYSLSVPSGTYTAELSLTNFVTTYFGTFAVGGRTIGEQNSAISPVLGSTDIRVVLTWGNTPADLDSYILDVDGDVILSPTQRTAAGLNLDVDDRNAYGPETVTISQLPAGSYRYAVWNYTDSATVSNSRLSNVSGARVRVFQGSTQIATFNVPGGQVGNLWTVFEINGTTGLITPINTVSAQPGGGGSKYSGDSPLQASAEPDGRSDLLAPKLDGQ